MNKSAKGRRNEHKSRNLLHAMGYRMVIRSTGSFGEWDLVGLSRTLPITLVQVKSNRKPTKLSDLEPYDPHWQLRYHVWMDYRRCPEVYDAITGDRCILDDAALRAFLGLDKS